jgi:hypothetical protein
MNKVLMSLLFSAFILTGTSFAQTPPPVAAPVAVVPVAVKPAHHEHHPELRKALHKLREAKQDLEKAAHDYGGHKVKAIEAIDHAIDEIQGALDFAKSEK